MKKRSEIAMGHTECPDFFIGAYRRMRGGLLLIFGISALLFIPELAEAQCSMCRAVTESNLKTDDAFTIGSGLNNAIVYLMFMPYILAGIFAYAFYGKQIRAWFKKKFVQ